MADNHPSLAEVANTQQEKLAEMEATLITIATTAPISEDVGAWYTALLEHSQRIQQLARTCLENCGVEVD